MENEQWLIDASPDDCIKKVKRKTNFAKIIVSGTAEKPYYEIMWFDYMDGQYHIGYGSNNLNFVFQWLAECFEVEEAPTVDAVEVVHGRWAEKIKDERFGDEWDEIALYECSVCKSEFVEGMGAWRYCPNCGAKMDGGKGDDLLRTMR